MYYLLNYIPAVIQLVIFLAHIVNGFTFHNDGVKIAYGTFLIFITPVYLVIVNKYFLVNRHISYPKSVFLMLTVVMFNTFAFMVTNKIKFGYFIGDVPEGIYYIMFFVPATVILIGILILYYVHRH